MRHFKDGSHSTANLLRRSIDGCEIHFFPFFAVTCDGLAMELLGGVTGLLDNFPIQQSAGLFLKIKLNRLPYKNNLSFC